MIHRQVQPRRLAGAFTLIELLTVVAIIALLLGLLMPALPSARSRAKNVKTLALLKDISQALEAFKSENEREFRASNGYPPSAGYRVGAMDDSPAMPSAPRQDVFNRPVLYYSANPFVARKGGQIVAGRDGLYGTKDDVNNFAPRCDDPDHT
jgi:prepilin-type N-terminal cleavage/methylation domain-containing protein